MDSISPDIPQRQCTKCGKTFPATHDYFDYTKLGKYGLQARCRKCKSAYYQSHKEEHGEKMKQYYREHIEEARDYNHQYRLAHKEKIRLYEKERRKRPEEYQSLKQQYNTAYADQRRIYDQLYRHAHRAERRASYHNREARKKAIPGKHTPKQIQEQYQRQKGKCYYCNHKIKWGNHHIDHTFPLSREGASNDISYLVITCPSCNIRKGNRFPWEWPEGGRLL